MTRINCIPVKELTNRHLLSEYRELPRVFKRARKAPDAPKEYTMGKGHVLFFYDKLQYLIDRQKELVAECKRRGFNVRHDDPDELRKRVADDCLLWNDWTPTDKAQQINRQRIKERLGND